MWQCVVDSLSHAYKTGLTTKLPLLNATKHRLNAQMRPVLRHDICPCSILVTFNICHICDTSWKSNYLVEQKGDVALFEAEGKIGSCFQTVTLSCGQVWLNDEDSFGLEEKPKWLRIGGNVLSCGISKCHQKRVVFGSPFTLTQHTKKKELKLACKKNKFSIPENMVMMMVLLQADPEASPDTFTYINEVLIELPFSSHFGWKFLGYHRYFQWY